MECVIDTSAVSWMGRIGELELLAKVYNRILAPPGVFEQLESHYATEEFVSQHIKPVRFFNEKEKRRFQRLLRRWKKKVPLVEDPVDIQVFIAHRFFTDTNEALYANSGAERNFKPYGNVRDIIYLFVPAENEKIFSKKDTLEFLDKFYQNKYRRSVVKSLIKELRV
jgi:hypothetical protein